MFGEGSARLEQLTEFEQLAGSDILLRKERLLLGAGLAREGSGDMDGDLDEITIEDSTLSPPTV